MANKKVDEAKVQRIVFEMAMAFGKGIKPEVLSDDAVAAFQEGFSKSVHDALTTAPLVWEDDHPHKPGYTWRTFILKLVKKVAKELSKGHTAKKKVSAATFIETVVSVGNKNGCPSKAPLFAARWCSAFIMPVSPARKKRKSKKAPRRRGK